MKNINLSNISKHLILVIISVLSIFLYVNMGIQEITNLSLYELYFSKSFFNIFIGLDHLTILMIIPFCITFSNGYKLNSVLQFLIYSILFLISPSIYFQILWAYLLLSAMNDQRGKKNLLFTLISIALIGILLRATDYSIQYYVPFIIITARSLFKRTSIVFDIISLAFCINTLQLPGAVPELWNNIFFVLVFLIGRIKENSRDELTLFAFWALFSGFPVHLVVTIYALSIYRKSLGKIEIKPEINNLIMATQLFIYIFILYSSHQKALLLVFPLLMAFRYVSEETKEMRL